MTNPYAPPEAAPDASASMARGAVYALAVLFSMNLLNYVDRYVFAAVGPGIMRDLRINKLQFGYLGSAFIIVYTMVSPLIGVLGDRFDRRKLLAFGVGLWSVATVGTAYARSFNQMFLARAILGVGEASYGIVAPTLLADFFDAKRRGRVMGIFYLALPVGTAIGYGAGGIMEKLAGWPSAFWVVGPPGLLLAGAGLLMRDPGRGTMESSKATEQAPPGLADYLTILKTPSFLLNTAGLAAVTFTTGAFGHWIPSYFECVHHTKPENKAYLGIALALAGLTGVIIGMILPDRLQRWTKRAYLLWAGVAVFLAVPFGCLGLLSPSLGWSLGLLTLASVLMSSCLGPCNTVTANVVPGSRRAAGFAISIFLLHLLGDIPSPPLVGYVADRLGLPGAGETALGRFFEGLGALPVMVGHDRANITAGMLLIAPVLLIGSLCFFLGARFLPADQDRARALSQGHDDHSVLHL